MIESWTHSLLLRWNWMTEGKVVERGSDWNAKQRRKGARTEILPPPPVEPEFAACACE
jgi:hypothetical protein